MELPTEDQLKMSPALEENPWLNALPAGKLFAYPDVAAAIADGTRVLDLPFRSEHVTVETTTLGPAVVLRETWFGEQASSWVLCPDLETALAGAYTVVARWLIQYAPMAGPGYHSWTGTVDGRTWGVEHDSGRGCWHVATGVDTDAIKVHRLETTNAAVGWRFVAAELAEAGVAQADWEPSMLRGRRLDLVE